MRIYVNPTEEYLISRAMLTLKIREAAEAVFESLGEALEKLKKSGWDKDLPIRQVGGNKFAYAFHEKYEVTFRIRDKKPSFQPPEEMWLKLLTLRLRKPESRTG